MNPVVHFEMPYENRERLVKFYTQAFGWQMRKLGKEMGDYVTAATTETDENRMVKRPSAINGGFFPKKTDWPAQYPSVVISVDDIKEAMKKVTNGGAEVLGEPIEIPGIGQYVSFTDTEGNRVSILQPPMPNPNQDAREIVMSYIKALDSRDYDSAREWLGDNVLVKGPAGEAFRSPDEFISMMRQQQGEYDIKKVFVDADDVCLLYDFITKTATVFFSSWYKVKNGKITSIRTVFDPRPFAAMPEKK
jgi:predicted enzyme related to lactoylglutathione lyase